MDKKTINSPEDIKTFVENMTEEQKSSLVSVFKQGVSDLISKYEIEVSENENDIANKTKEEEELWEQQRTGSYEEKEALSNKRTLLKIQIKRHKNKVRSLKNLIICLQNGGMAVEITDQHGFKHHHIADFREVSTNNILFNEETILVDATPVYIPVIDEESFRQKGYVFDAIRYDKNSYLLCTGKYEESKDFEGYSHFVIVTLDQLVLISEYYYMRAKAKAVLDAEEKNKRSEAYYDNLPYERRLAHLNQKGYYRAGLPVAVKKKITEAEYEALSLEEKEKLYKPFKTYRAERLKTKLEEKQMWVSFHEMYQQFVNKEAHPINIKGELLVGKKAGFGNYGNPEIFQYWYVFREMMDYKIKDLRAQREYLSEGYLTALETSFGESNTSTALKEKFGILVKRQNGDEIKPLEIDQIEEAFTDIQKVYGNLKNIALKKNLKVSHTGKKYAFSGGRALGIFIPSMQTVASTDKYGNNRFKSVMSHELAHFIDNYIGDLNGKRYASDDYENTAGILAFTFRNNMNKPKSEQTDYINATQECFARALQQYFGIETMGEDSGFAVSAKELDREVPLFINENFVPKDKYYGEIKPLIEKFFQENEDIFKFTVDIDNTNVPLPLGSEKLDIIDIEKVSDKKDSKIIWSNIIEFATQKLYNKKGDTDAILRRVTNFFSNAKNGLANPLGEKITYNELKEKVYLDKVSDFKKNNLDIKNDKQVDFFIENFHLNKADFIYFYNKSLNTESNVEDEITEALEVLHLLLETASDDEKTEIKEAIDVLKLLSNVSESEDKIVLYHGTTKDNNFDKFDLKHANLGVSSNSFSQGNKGIYLTENPNNARYFSRKANEGYHMKKYDRRQLETGQKRTKEEILSSQEEAWESLFGETASSQENVKKVTLSKDAKIKDLDYYPTSEQIEDLMKLNKYDGVRFDEKGLEQAEDVPSDLMDKIGGKTIFIFNPEVIEKTENISNN